MTVPRLFPSDEPYHAIERYLEGRFFTPPKIDIINGVLTIVSRYCDLYDVALVAWVIVGNHIHFFLVDKDPSKPSQVWRVLQQSKSKMTSWLRDYWGIDDPIFTETVMSELFPVLDRDRVVDTIAYIETNMQKDGLINRASELPRGAVSVPSMRNEPLVVPLPEGWFREKTWGKQTVIRPELPDWLLEKIGLSRCRYEHRVDAEVFRRSYNYVGERKGKAKGLKKLLKNSPAKKGRKIKKTKKVKCAGSRASCARFYLRERRFGRSYRRSFERVRDGKHRTMFPYGTGRMVTSYGFKMYVPPG